MGDSRFSGPSSHGVFHAHRAQGALLQKTNLYRAGDHTVGEWGACGPMTRVCSTPIAHRVRSYKEMPSASTHTF